MKKVRKKAGQPTSYKPEYCQLLIEHMGTGLSYETFAAKAGVSKQTLYNWEEQFPEFLDAKSKATALSQMWWESIGIQHLINDEGAPTLNTTLWIFNMKNRFGWRDKQPGEDTIKINIHQEFKTKLESKRKELFDVLRDVTDINLDDQQECNSRLPEGTKP